MAQMQNKIQAMAEENDELQQQLEICEQQLYTAREKVYDYSHITHACIEWRVVMLMLQETEKDKLVQTRSKELAQAQEQLRQLRQQVSKIR